MLIYSDKSLIYLGTEGSDAGGWRFNPVTGKWERVPGWEVDRFVDLVDAVSILGQAVAFKNPRLVDGIAGQLGKFVHEELSAYLGEMGSR